MLLHILENMRCNPIARNDQNSIEKLLQYGITGECIPTTKQKVYSPQCRQNQCMYYKDFFPFHKIEAKYIIYMTIGIHYTIVKSYYFKNYTWKLLIALFSKLEHIIPYKVLYLVIINLLNLLH